MRGVDGLVEAEALGNLLIRRIAQDHVAAADQHRHVAHGDVKPVEHFLDVAVALEVDVGIGMPVAGEELPDPQRAP